MDRELVEQYVQDPEIAERFALYYDLFNKYRSDYQVDEILHGQVSPDIVKRAKEAAFDERLALLGLMLDGVSGLAAKALEREAVLMDVRDVLRAKKERIISGASAKDELAAAIAEREERLEKRQKADTATAIDLRVARFWRLPC